MYIRLSIDMLTVVQKGLTTTVGPEDRRTPRMQKEAGDTVMRLPSAVFPSSWRSGEVPRGWRKADIASTPNRANTTPASGKTVDLQTFTCLETASVKGKKGTGITLPRTDCAQCWSAAGMRWQDLLQGISKGCHSLGKRRWGRDLTATYKRRSWRKLIQRCSAKEQVVAMPRCNEASSTEAKGEKKHHREAG